MTAIPVWVGQGLLWSPVDGGWWCVKNHYVTSSFIWKSISIHFLKNENKPLRHPRDINHVFSLPQKTTRRWTLIFQRRQAIYMNESQFELHSTGAKIYCSRALYTYLGILLISKSLEALRGVTEGGAIWRNRFEVAEVTPAFWELWDPELRVWKS